jgi:aminoglycoside/choline kinase family phosphotransferase
LLVVRGPGGISEDLAVIDFQDTRRGPRAYDLASLAWDPYVSLPQELMDDLVEAWRPIDASRAEWHDEVALAAGQRLIKAAGSYAWLGHGCGRAEYLRWFAPALSRALERLADWPSRDDLRRRFADCGIVF